MCIIYLFQTYASKMLIAINPFQTMTNLYGSEEIEKYKCKFSNAPHLYAIGEDSDCWGIEKSQK